MFKQFPKVRPPLSAALAGVYEQHLRENRSGGSAATSVSQRLEAWMHRAVAADVRDGAVVPTLEIGAGTLNQLAYEPPNPAYDVVEPFEPLYRDSPHRGGVRQIYRDLREVVAEARYGRVTAIAVFEHLCDLPDVVARCGLLLAPGGALRIAIPSEGRWLWKLGWSITTGVEFRLRHGLDYGELMRHEHVNTAAEIEEVLRHFFADIRSRFFGVGRALSLYQYHECRVPDVQRCRSHLDGVGD